MRIYSSNCTSQGDIFVISADGRLLARSRRYLLSFRCFIALITSAIQADSSLAAFSKRTGGDQIRFRIQIDRHTIQPRDWLQDRLRSNFALRPDSQRLLGINRVIESPADGFVHAKADFSKLRFSRVLQNSSDCPGYAGLSPW